MDYSINHKNKAIHTFTIMSKQGNKHQKNKVKNGLPIILPEKIQGNNFTDKPMQGRKQDNI